MMLRRRFHKIGNSIATHVATSNPPSGGGRPAPGRRPNITTGVGHPNDLNMIVRLVLHEAIAQNTFGPNRRLYYPGAAQHLIDELGLK